MLAMNIQHQLSDTLLDLPAHRLHEQLTGPSLFLLPGHAPRPLFVSILLHGNEYTGWEVIRRLLKSQQGPLPRPLALFIGNVEAARHRARRLDQQPDFNRCWPGAACDNEITQLFQQVYDWAAQQDLLASIDIHNNTGNNPLYSIINRSDAATCQLARDFAPTTVFTRYPRGIQSEAFSHLAPSITLECAQPGEPEGIERALALVKRYLSPEAESLINKAHSRAEAEQADDLTLYCMRARVTVPKRVDLCQLPYDGQLRLAPHLDRFNFKPLQGAALLGQSRLPLQDCLRAEDGKGNDVTQQFFHIYKGALRTRRTIVPGMFTSDPVAIQRDCLGYIMEEITPEECAQLEC